MTTAMIDSALGKIAVWENDGFICGVSFLSHDNIHLSNVQDEAQDKSIIQEAILQLNEYFEGKRTKFTLPLQPKGTQFQKKCWDQLLRIPFGKTNSYEEQAIGIGGKKYVRAVGQANKSNPIAIIIPCHRVIGKNNQLTGYASGVKIKKWLLDFEADHIQD